MRFSRWLFVWVLSEFVAFVMMCQAIGCVLAILLLMGFSMLGVTIMRVGVVPHLFTPRYGWLTRLFPDTMPMRLSYSMAGLLLAIPGYVTSFAGLVVLMIALFTTSRVTKSAASFKANDSADHQHRTVEGECWHENK